MRNERRLATDDRRLPARGLRWLLLILLLLLAGCGGDTPATDETAVNGLTQGMTESGDDADAHVAELGIRTENAEDAGTGTLLQLRIRPGLKLVTDVEGNMELRYDETYLPPGEEGIVESEFSFTLTTETKSVENGLATVATVSSPFLMPGLGEFSEQGSELTVDAHGQIHSFTAGTVRGIHALPFVPFPDGRVSPGDVWAVGSAHRAPILMALTLEETYTFGGVEKRAGRDLWRVEMRAVSEDGSVEINATYYLDPETGFPIEAEIEQTASIAAPYLDRGNIPATVKMVLKLTARKG